MKLETMWQLHALMSPPPWSVPDPEKGRFADDIIRGKDGIRLAGSCCCGGFVRPDDERVVEVRNLFPKLLEFVGQALHMAEQLDCICDEIEDGEFPGRCRRCWILVRAKDALEADE